GHAAARGAGGAFLPRLLLLSAAVYLLGRSSALRAAATGQYRCECRESGGSRADRRADSPTMETHADHPARGFWFLPRRADGLVRNARRGLLLRLGAQPARASEDRAAVTRGETGATAARARRAGVHRVSLPDAEELVAVAARGGQGRASGERREPAL